MHHFIVKRETEMKNITHSLLEADGDSIKRNVKTDAAWQKCVREDIT